MSKLLRNPGIDSKESITGLLKGVVPRDEYFVDGPEKGKSTF